MMQKVNDIIMHISENQIYHYLAIIVIGVFFYVVVHSQVAKKARKEVEKLFISRLPDVSEKMKAEEDEKGIEKMLYDVYHFSTKGCTYGLLAVVCLVTLLVDYFKQGNSTALVVTAITCIISFMECYDNIVVAREQRRRYYEVAKILAAKHIEYNETAIEKISKPVIEEFAALSDFDKIMRFLRNYPRFKKRVVVKVENEIMFDTWIEVNEKSFSMLNIPKEVKNIPRRLDRYNAEYVYDIEKAIINIKQSKQIIWLYFYRNKDWG